MKFEVEIRKSTYRLDEGNDKLVWIVEIDSQDSGVIHLGRAKKLTTAFHEAFTNLCIDLVDSQPTEEGE